MANINSKTLFDEKVIASHEEYIDNEQIQIFVTIDSDNEDYYNVYRINEKYITDKMNSLDLQEPVLSISDPKEYFNTGYMIARIMEYIIWDRFYKYGTSTIAIDIKFESQDN